MRFNRTISVNIEAWNEAQRKVENMSAYINSCVEALAYGSNTDDDKTLKEYEDEIELIKHEQSESSIRLTILSKLVKDLKDNKVAQIKANEELEEFNRWVCGVPRCGHKNFMDAIKCGGCGLPTRNDSKTVIINIKGDA